MKKIILIVIIFFFTQLTYGQFPKKELLKELEADKIEMDEGNGDGVFKARNKKTKKWGMFQWMYNGVKTTELIPMNYDSVNYFSYNGTFTEVYNNEKVGFYLSAWSYENAKQTVPCMYDDYHKFTFNNKTYLAVKKNNKWGWLNWFTGEEKSDFIYKTKEDIPSPDYEQLYY